MHFHGPVPVLYFYVHPDSLKAFLRFLDSDAWNEIRGMFGSKDAMKRVSDAMERGANIDDLVNAYNDFVAGESESEDILQVWDGWVSE